MIRFRRLTLGPLNAWLSRQTLPASVGRYELRGWKEVGAHFGLLRDELVAYAQEALDDARLRIRKGFEDSLSPFSGAVDDPAAHQCTR